MRADKSISDMAKLFKSKLTEMGLLLGLFLTCSPASNALAEETTYES